MDPAPVGTDPDQTWPSIRTARAPHRIPPQSSIVKRAAHVKESRSGRSVAPLSVMFGVNGRNLLVPFAASSVSICSGLR
jgi:hypothetical protein